MLTMVVDEIKRSCKMRTILAVVLSVILCTGTVCAMPPDRKMLHEDGEGRIKKEQEEEPAKQEPELTARSAVLVEASTGKIIYEKQKEEQLPPASVTKVMTMLLILDAVEDGKIRLEDEVTVSEYAASMGGSQVFLEPGEVQTVDTMLKCIAVASANDACVAMAEYIAGSEETFVEQMNARAKGLGMEHTHFVNCNGLDADGHLTTAYDIALMSRELITKHPEIENYSMIWMETITHKTRKGTSEFGLSNTNKLVRHYPYATGLKTGSTSKAKFCISATARKDGLDLIAVIMAAPDSKMRVKDATTLLNYGFGKCTKYEEEETGLKPAKIARGTKETLKIKPEAPFRYVDTTGANLSGIRKKLKLKKELTAPVKKGEKVGELVYTLQGETLGSVAVRADQTVDEITYGYVLKKMLRSFLL